MEPKKQNQAPDPPGLSLDVDVLRKKSEIEDPAILSSPRQVGFFSLDNNRSFCLDNSQLKFLNMPPINHGVHFDLTTAASEAVTRRYRQNEGIDNILSWIIQNKSRLQRERSEEESLRGSLNADFVCNRGLLVTAMYTLYEENDGWIICATKLRGNIYMRLFDAKDKRIPTDRERENSNWGHKFEQYVTSVYSFPVWTNPERPVNENPEFRIMVSRDLNEHSLLICAEVDCLKPSVTKDYPQTTGSTSEYVELKTNKEIRNEYQEKTLQKNKMVKWWAQSYLIGVPVIYCGFRNRDGIVKIIMEFKTENLPLICEGKWSEKVCMNFLDGFLTFVKSCVEKDDHRIVYKFEWSPGQKISCNELQQPGEYQVLTNRYINEVLNETFDESTEETALPN